MPVAAGPREDGCGVPREYALAVVVAAGVVITVLTMLADELYRAYIRFFGL